MMRFLAIISCLFVFNAFASNTVRIFNANTMEVSGTTNTTFVLGSDVTSSDATAESAAAKVYVPIARVTTTPAFDNQKYFSLYATQGVTTLFDISSTTQTVSFPLLLTTGATANYLYAAVKVGTSFYAIAQYPNTTTPTQFTNVTNQTVYFPITMKKICDQVISSGGTSCNNLALASTVEVNPSQENLIYFFQSPTNISIAVPGGQITPTDGNSSGGIYFKALMSNRVYEASELTVTLSGLKIGDARLIFTVANSSQMADFKKMLIFNHQGSPVAVPNSPAGDYTTGSFIDLNYLSQNGEIVVNQLGNGAKLTNGTTDYFFSAALVDKFNFASTISDDVVGRPLEIEQLLKKQACFLLTAGFGEEHYIITYFRNFRDQVLAKNFIGIKFIHFYYEKAPKYAQIIYKSEVLRLGIRMFAYILYFIFKNFWLLMIELSLILFVLLTTRVGIWQQQRKI